MSLVATALCYISAGPSLGLYLGSMAMSAVMVPAMIAGRRRAIDAILTAGAFVDAMGLIWLIGLLRSGEGILQWLECYLVLAAFVSALVGATWLGRRILGRSFAAVLTVGLALAWLLWPVWLSPQLHGQAGAAAVSWLTPAHPMLAINHVLIDEGVWTQQQLMYQHTALGQDIAYALPHSIWASFLIHLAIGAALLWAGGWMDHPRRGPAELSPTPAHD